MIDVNGISKYFGRVKAVDGISFRVHEQQNMILLGTSGCGKTTTLKMINRLIEPSAGSISINGKNIQQQQPEVLRRSIGYVLQNNGLFPHYTIAQNIAVVPQLLRWDKKRIQNRTAELMEKLHLDQSYLNAYPNELSGGQQQRVGLARALVSDPPVLLMDEPFGALDNVTRSNIHKEFKALDELKRKTIIMVTHDVQEAFELGDTICLMDKGQIVQSGTPTDLLFNPVNEFVVGFLKDQRLQLEFKAIRLNDLWDKLPGLPVQSNPDALSGQMDVWEALELFKHGDKQTLNFINNSNEQKTIGFEQLMSAFYQFKQRRQA
ncbi:MAG TPA: ABC transporter ATP-binding protein [Mucilaginibacter sp.]